MTVPDTSELAGLDNETATDGPWHFTLAVPPVELDDIALWRDGDLVCSWSRPRRDD